MPRPKSIYDCPIALRVSQSMLDFYMQQADRRAIPLGTFMRSVLASYQSSHLSQNKEKERQS